MTSSDLPNSAITGVNLMVGLSDSIGFGFGTTNPPDTSHINLDGVALGANWAFLNLAIPGQTFAQARAKAAHIPFASMAFSGHRVLLVAHGTNDLNTGETAAALITDFNSEFTASKSAGYTDIVLTTITPRASAQAAIDTANTSIKGAGTSASKIVDYTANPHLTNPADSTYFQDDGLHLKDAGEQARSTSDMAVFNAAFPSSTPPATPPATDPYQSDYTNAAFVEVNFKPNAPGSFTATGLGTALRPEGDLVYTVPANMQGGRIVFERRLHSSSDPWIPIGKVDGPDANTAPPAIFQDLTVTNGATYEWRAYALPKGDFNPAVFP